MDPVVIKKSAGQEIQMGVAEFKGKSYFSIRLYIRGEDGEWFPTKKGVTLPVGMLPEVLAGVKQVADQAVKGGMLEPQLP